jgi:hypothetical protein
MALFIIMALFSEQERFRAKVSHAPAFPDLEKVVYYFLINDLP